MSNHHIVTAMKKKIALVFGTRPEAIKLSPLYLELTKHEEFEPLIWVTGQHQEMLYQTLGSFKVPVHEDFKIMQQGQTLTQITSKTLESLETKFKEERPDLLIVQGDTTTAFAGALAAFYAGIPVAHVEAGLRTETIKSPFPEELNRRLIGKIADFHFAPTSRSRDNLLKDGVPENTIWTTGNTGIDALSLMHKEVLKSPPSSLNSLLAQLNNFSKTILITGHRRESFGTGFQNICTAIKTLAEENKDIGFLYPVHLNPNVKDVVFEKLGDLSNIILTDPLGYEEFIYLIDKSYLILTDSGGIQEEAPHLGKPVVVMRENTERPEAIDAGTSILVGTDPDKIISNVTSLIQDQVKYKAMSNAINPFGDGRASIKITEILKTALKN